MSESGDAALEELSDRCGIGRNYHDFRGDWREVSADARLAVLSAMGFDSAPEAARSALAALDEQAARPLPHTLLLRNDHPLRVTLKVPEANVEDGWRLQITREDGTVQPLALPSLNDAPVREVAGRLMRCTDLALEYDGPPGYHQLQLTGPDGEVHTGCALLVAPPTAFQPQPIAGGGRVYGLTVQLYSVRSERNWGMGDFTDLSCLLRDAATAGAQVLGLNPLHALFPANPLHFSPYSPSHRVFLNVMYIDPQAVPNYAGCEEARAMVETPDFQGILENLRAAHHVDYKGVAECKLPVLEALHRQFQVQHCRPGSTLGRAFAEFIARHGDALRLHATFDAMHEHFHGRDHCMSGWLAWPEAYRDPGSTAVADFARDNADRIHFYQFLQWCAAEQLRAAQATALRCGMAIGIYLDLSVGVDLNGSEVWSRQAAFCPAASAGAPPDELARSGQDWGFPPLDPRHLFKTAYRQFVDVLRANMSLCGAVRYDHAVSLLRLWWIPRPGSAAEGAYVNYPLEDLLGVIALESHRNRCLVIGEDLGTVPGELREALARNHVFSYRVLYFERTHDGMVLPDGYPREAVATVTTHDLPTLASWWDGSDIELRAGLGLLGSPEVAAEMRSARVQEKQRLLDALVQAQCWDGERDAGLIPGMTRRLSIALHRFLARSRSAVMLVQLEDAMEMLSPVNVPGTTDEHRNWQRKLRWPLEGLFQREGVASLLASVREERP